MQAAPTGLVKNASAEGPQLVATGLGTQNSADSAEIANAGADGIAGPSEMLPSNGHVNGSAVVLPMEVDDDAMFQKKQPKLSRTDSHQVMSSFICPAVVIFNAAHCYQVHDMQHTAHELSLVWSACQKQSLKALLSLPK